MIHPALKSAGCIIQLVNTSSTSGGNIYSQKQCLEMFTNVILKGQKKRYRCKDVVCINYLSYNQVIKVIQSENWEEL